MKNLILVYIAVGVLIQACALNEPEVQADVVNYPFRLVIDEEGADLADAEDYDAEVAFADYLGELPSSEIVLSYTLEGEGDFANVSIDEIVYEYEDDDCVYIREVMFTGSTITVPVDPDLGTVPEAFEVVFSFNLPADEATDGGFAFTLTDLDGAENVLINAVSTFEYEILDNDAAGDWVYTIASEAEFESFQEAFGNISIDLAELAYADITGDVFFSFEFEEVKMEVELVETEEVEKCEDGVTEVETENVVVELKAEYGAEDGEMEWEGKYFSADGEELDYIAEYNYLFNMSDYLELTIELLIDQDNFADGEELYTGDFTMELMPD